MRKTSPPTSSPNSPNSRPPQSLWSPKAASRLAAPPFSLTSPTNSSPLTPAIIPQNHSAGWKEAPRIAPFPQPEYPLFSHGGLRCASMRQGSGSSLESSRQQFWVLLSVLLYVLPPTPSSSATR